MAVPIRPGGRRPSPLFRLTSGSEVLDEWAQTATQVEKNIVNDVLFAVVGKSVFSEYIVVDDVRKTMEFFVFARCDLVIKIRVHDLNSFGIVYVGPSCAAPGLDYAGPDQDAYQAESVPDWRYEQD